MLRKSLGVPITPRSPDWARTIAQLAATKTARGKVGWLRLMRKAGALLASSEEHRQALDALLRLGADARAQIAWLVALGKGEPPPKPSDEELEAERQEARAKLVARRAAHARAKLAEAERRLRVAQRLVKKWGRRVGYYEKRGIE